MSISLIPLLLMGAGAAEAATEAKDIPTQPAAMPTPTLPAPPEKPRAASEGGGEDGGGRGRLLGDWGGLRSTLVDAGITPSLVYTAHTVTNVRGGTQSKFMNAGQFVAGLRFDLDKIADLPGTFQLGIVKRYGESFNQKSGINALVNPMSIQGRGKTFRISQLWYRTKIGKLDVKLGRMFLNEDFNPGRCDFISGYFCLGENTRSNSTIWPTSPVSMWAARLQYAVRKDVTVKGAVYQYNPKNLDMERNFYIGWKGATGIVAPFEINYTPRFDGKAGNYAIGLFYSNADMNDPILNSDHQLRAVYGGTPLIRHNECGAYFNARQTVRKAAADGSGRLDLFLNGSFLSEQSTPNNSAIAMGLSYTGLIPGRPRDELGLAFGRGRVNDRITDAARYINDNDLGHQPVRTAEYVAEAYYGIGVLPGFTIQPDIQFIFQPRGDPGERNAILLGARTQVSF